MSTADRMIQAAAEAIFLSIDVHAQTADVLGLTWTEMKETARAPWEELGAAVVHAVVTGKQSSRGAAIDAAAEALFLTANHVDRTDAAGVWAAVPVATRKPWEEAAEAAIFAVANLGRAES